MDGEAKIKNPIIIRLGSFENVVVPDKTCNKLFPLKDGLVFGGEHYGFVLIVDTKGKQTEEYYKSKRRIFGTGLSESGLHIYEEGNGDYWLFSKDGNLEHMPADSKVASTMDIVCNNIDILIGRKLLNPICIRVAKDPKDSVILSDNNEGKDTPICPGAMFGGERYGFILLIETKDGIKKVEYPTQNRITAIGAEDVDDDIKVYEEGKYMSWVFDKNGKFKRKSSYYKFSLKDRSFIENSYEQSADTDEDRFTINPIH